MEEKEVETGKACPYCGGLNLVKAGIRISPQGKVQRYLCRGCGKTITRPVDVKVTVDTQLFYTLTSVQVESIKEKLSEIQAKRGPFSTDHLTHAENVIESNAKLATDILKILQEAKK